MQLPGSYYRLFLGCKMDQNGASDNGQGFHLSHVSTLQDRYFRHPDAPNFCTAKLTACDHIQKIPSYSSHDRYFTYHKVFVTWHMSVHFTHHSCWSHVSHHSCYLNTICDDFFYSHPTVDPFLGLRRAGNNSTQEKNSSNIEHKTTALRAK